MKETSPPRDSRVVAGHSMEMLAAGLARDGVGGERSTSDISGSPGSPSPKEGGREGPAKQNQASAAQRTKQDFRKQTQTKTLKLRSKKGKEEDTRTPNKRKQNSIWVATMTKSKDNKHKHAWVRGESALEVRRTWISK